MIAIFDQGEDDIVLCQSRDQLDCMTLRDVGIEHALQNADRTAGFDHAAQQ
jgi:hypothetical protein